MKTAAGYRSGFCAHARHDRCRGAWGAAVCDCTCHDEPEPEAAMDALVQLTEEMGLYEEAPPPLPTHAVGVASVGYAGKLAQAVCSCGWAAPEARRRNHDAFDDARSHLAATTPDAEAVA